MWSRPRRGPSPSDTNSPTASGVASFGLGILVGLGVLLGGWLIFEAFSKNQAADADATTPHKAALSRTVLQQFALVVFGLAAIVTGAVAVFRGKDGTTATATVTAGFAVIALVYLGPSLQSIKPGTLKLVLAEFEKDAVQAENDGDEERAEDIRRTAMNAVLVALRETGNPVPTPPKPSAAQAENARWTETETLDLLQAVMAIAFKYSTIEKWPRIHTGKPGNPPRADLLIASPNSSKCISSSLLDFRRRSANGSSISPAS